MQIQNYFDVKEALLVSPKTTLVAVSKGQPIEKILTLFAEGQQDFGENYCDELCEKASQLKTLLEPKDVQKIKWHFLGRIQTNKIKKWLPIEPVVHGVGSLKHARELSKNALKSLASPLPCFLQVKVMEDPNKGGFLPEELKAQFFELQALTGITWLGLMGIPPLQGDSESFYQKIFELKKQFFPSSTGKLSIGMSSDYQIALKFKPTYVRIGEALFGKRSVRHQKP